MQLETRSEVAADTRRYAVGCTLLQQPELSCFSVVLLTFVVVLLTFVLVLTFVVIVLLDIVFEMHCHREH